MDICMYSSKKLSFTTSCTKFGQSDAKNDAKSDTFFLKLNFLVEQLKKLLRQGIS